MHLKSTIATGALALAATAHASVNIAISGFDYPYLNLSTYYLTYQKNFFGEYTIQPTVNQSDAIDFDILENGLLESVGGIGGGKSIGVTPIQAYFGPTDPAGVTFTNYTGSAVNYTYVDSSGDVLNTSPEWATWVICVSQYGSGVDYGAPEFNVTEYNSGATFPCYTVSFYTVAPAASATTIVETSTASIYATTSVGVVTSVYAPSATTPTAGLTTSVATIEASPTGSLATSVRTIIVSTSAAGETYGSSVTALASVTCPASCLSTITETAAGSTVTITESATVTVTVQSGSSATESPLPAPSSTTAAPASAISSDVVTVVTETSPSTLESTTANSASATSTYVAATTLITATVTASSIASSSAAAESACPLTLDNKSFQYPHLIVPVNASSPDTAYGTQYYPMVSAANPRVATIFSFDIPASFADMTCSLVFALPTQAQLQTSSYTLSGSGELSFYELTSPAAADTTWDTAPSSMEELGTASIVPGAAATVISSGACMAGETVSYEVFASGDLALSWFQDYNDCAIGVFVVAS